MNEDEKKNEAYDPSLKARDFKEMSQKEYMIERLNDQLKYYDKVANRSKKRYLQSRTISVVAGALVPVLVNLTFPYSQIITTILSVIVVLIVSLEGVWHFREQWVNARSTSEALRKEYFVYSTGEGVYKNFKDPKNAFILFVERIEALIEAENNSTLQAMTRESGDKFSSWKSDIQTDGEPQITQQ